MKKKDLLFTFDYELFLGENSGSVKNCIIEPTEKVIEILDEFKVKAIFFVDCTYLYQLKKKSIEFPKASEDLKKIIDQIHELVLSGHDIYPHIHPHWVDAQYDPSKNQWSLLNIDKYRFDSLSASERDIIFRSSVDYLTDIIKYVKKDYKLNCYRAGGWCIQPFSNFYTFFKEYQIEAEFSVLGGSCKDTNASKFDFSFVEPNSKPYYFEDNVVQKIDNGTFKQYPISSIRLKKKSILNELSKRVLWRIPLGQKHGDGRGVMFKSKIGNTEYDNTMEMASIENMTIVKLAKYKSFLKSNSYMQLISHPKMLSPHNLYVLRKFLIFADSKFMINTDWRKIRF
jgi:hypothetical protein